MKFRKKPVIVEASQWFKHGDHPMVLEAAGHADGTAYCFAADNNVSIDTLGWIVTLEGGHIVSPGDWIIEGVKGELYPCKPDIFEATYTPVDEEAGS